MNSPLAGLHLQNVNTAKLLKFRWPARAQMRGKQSFPLISRPVPIGRRAKKIWRMMLEEPKELIGKQIIVEGGSSWLALFLIVDQEED